ncbi:MAG: hypothetical protein WCR20_03240 [Verrucomicrobiota bacterium]
MKRLSLVLGIVLVAGMAMAQPNTAVVTDNGSFNASYINQLGGVNGNNSATITQIGDLNNAAVGDHAASSLFPVLTGTKGITQSGKGNTGSISQTNLFTGTVSAGPEAGMGQYGMDNTATITQSHNSAWMQEYAFAKQVGNGNTSLQKQASMFGYSHVSQVGDENKAETQQSGGYSQKANILQNGDNNEAYQFQGSTTLSYTQNNVAEASQLGDHNQSWQVQKGSDNFAKTTQETNDNDAYLYQNGNFNKATILQKSGNFNVVNLTQDGGAVADILQNGANNTLMGVGDIMATSLNGSTLNLDQLGNGNTLQLQQTNGGAATVLQNGITNTSVVIQN